MRDEDQKLGARLDARRRDLDAKHPNQYGCDRVEECGYRYPSSVCSNPTGSKCPVCGLGKMIPDPPRSARMIEQERLRIENREARARETALNRRAKFKT
jgi:hypothetical protein